MVQPYAIPETHGTKLGGETARTCEHLNPEKGGYASGFSNWLRLGQRNTRGKTGCRWRSVTGSGLKHRHQRAVGRCSRRILRWTRVGELARLTSRALLRALVCAVVATAAHAGMGTTRTVLAYLGSLATTGHVEVPATAPASLGHKGKAFQLGWSVSWFGSRLPFSTAFAFTFVSAGTLGGTLGVGVIRGRGALGGRTWNRHQLVRDSRLELHSFPKRIQGEDSVGACTHTFRCELSKADPGSTVGL